MTALDLIIIWLCIVCVIRLVTYRRDGARFKRQYGFAAWAMIVAIGAIGIYTAGGEICTERFPIIMPIMLMLTLGLLYTRGNVAQLLNLRRLLHD